MSLLYRIERHLKKSGVSATVFGTAAINDPALVRHLRNGRQPRPKTEARILAFIEAVERARGTLMPRAREDAATALLRALGARLEGCECAFRIDELASRGWASATFSGARHRIAFSLVGAGAAAAADAFMEGLEDALFALRGHILADIALIGEERDPGGERVQVRIEALTVEDD